MTPSGTGIVDNRDQLLSKLLMVAQKAFSALLEQPSSTVEGLRNPIRRNSFRVGVAQQLA